MESINKNYTFNTYNALAATLSSLLPCGSSDDPKGYNSINTINNLNLNTGRKSTQTEYKQGSNGVVEGLDTIPKAIDDLYKRSGGTSLRMATSFMSDGINTLGVLSK